MTAIRVPLRAVAALIVLVSVQACSSQRREWGAPLARNHPLVGRVYDVANGRMVQQETLVAAIHAADVVLLGEQHDNVDHHRLEAELLGDLIASGKRPAVAFEQLDLEDQPLVDRARAEQTPDVSGAAARVAQAVGWESSGWPPFEQYRPLFEAAIGADLPIRAANLSRESLAASFGNADPKEALRDPLRGGVLATRAARAPIVDLTGEARDALAADIRESHCGHASDAMVDMMIDAQGRRDAAMSAALLEGLLLSERQPAEPGKSDSVEPRKSDSAEPGTSENARPRAGAVLIAGFGHARRDYGVALRLARLTPTLRVVSVAMLEVIPGVENPADYAPALHAGRLPFDYVIFTPRMSSEDPCELYRRSLEGMKRR